MSLIKKMTLTDLLPELLTNVVLVNELDSFLGDLAGLVMTRVNNVATESTTVLCVSHLIS